jgi:hypothetical protein
MYTNSRLRQDHFECRRVVRGRANETLFTPLAAATLQYMSNRAPWLVPTLSERNVAILSAGGRALASTRNLSSPRAGTLAVTLRQPSGLQRPADAALRFEILRGAWALSGVVGAVTLATARWPPPHVFTRRLRPDGRTTAGQPRAVPPR